MSGADADCPDPSFGVVVIGGALSGAATALLLLRERPSFRVLVLEKSASFPRKVGEATVEISAYFLSRLLGLMHPLNEQHLVKQGLRLWFTNDQARDVASCGEIGPRFLPRAAFETPPPFRMASAWPIVRALGRWVWLEVTGGWRTWFRIPAPARLQSPRPASAMRPVHRV